MAYHSPPMETVEQCSVGSSQASLPAFSEVSRGFMLRGIGTGKAHAISHTHTLSDATLLDTTVVCE